MNPKGLGSKLACSHCSILSTQLQDLAPKAYLSQREVEESSNDHWNAINTHTQELVTTNGWGGDPFILFLKN
jgi:hypothetical protein